MKKTRFRNIQKWNFTLDILTVVLSLFDFLFFCNVSPFIVFVLVFVRQKLEYEA